jgi:AraC-like DNA-binding protein
LVLERAGALGYGRRVMVRSSDSAPDAAAALARPLDVCCGTLVPRRRSSFATLYAYEFDAARGRARVDDKHFDFDCAVVTTRGRWRFHGRGGGALVDASTAVLGAAGDRYGCRHDAAAGDSNYVVCVAPHALDDGAPLFAARTVPAGDAIRLLERALRTTSDDAFDSLVFRLFDDLSALSAARSRNRARFRGLRAKRLIEQHAFERIRVVDLAAELGVSPFTFFRQFRHDVGTTPLAYVSELRFARAEHLLTGSRLPVEEVARRVGFGDPAYFSRFFRRRAGRPPSSYRA